MNDRHSHLPFGCSTLLLAGGEVLAHNLDMPDHIPGVVMSNPRGLDKRGTSLTEILTGAAADTPELRWTSTYGSLTFVSFAPDAIDGGINEAGLYIQEMSLGESVLPAPDGRPVVFMAQWMQYVLDTTTTVEAALRTLDDVTIDGWGWHFVLSDAAGDRAVVEFIDGDLIVNRGDEVMHLVVCNGIYTDEVADVVRFQPFGGDEAVAMDDQEVPRFVHGAMLAGQHAGGATLDEAFDALRILERGETQWSYVVDRQANVAAFRTAVSPAVKTLDLTTLDFSAGAGRRYVDIDVAGPGEVTLDQRFTAEDSQRFATVAMNVFDQIEPEEWDALMEHFGGAAQLPLEATKRRMAQRLATLAPDLSGEPVPASG